MLGMFSVQYSPYQKHENIAHFCFVCNRSVVVSLYFNETALFFIEILDAKTTAFA